MPETVTIRITIVAKNGHGHIADVKGWAASLDQDIRLALSNDQGADLDIDSLLIERKLEGFEKVVEDGKIAK